MTGPASARLDRNAKASAPGYEVGGANKFARNKVYDWIVTANSFAPLRHGDGVVGALLEFVVVTEDLGQVAFHVLTQSIDGDQIESTAWTQALECVV